MNLSNGRIWPYTIAFLIIMVFGFCVATVVVTSSAPVQKSDAYMMDYQEVDANANKIIKARIAFNKKYKITYATQGLSMDETTLEYKIVDRQNNPVNDAKLEVIITRPLNHQFDQDLVDPSVKNGVYTFSSIKLPKEGRWNIMAKVDIEDSQRFYNIKADTRKSEVTEY